MTYREREIIKAILKHHVGIITEQEMKAEFMQGEDEYQQVVDVVRMLDENYPG